MAQATLSVVGGASGTKQSNHQRWQEFIGTLRSRVVDECV